jgi:hypothetical protein
MGEVGGLARGGKAKAILIWQRRGSRTSTSRTSARIPARLAHLSGGSRPAVSRHSTEQQDRHNGTPANGSRRGLLSIACSGLSRRFLSTLVVHFRVNAEKSDYKQYHHQGRNHQLRSILLRKFGRTPENITTVQPSRRQDVIGHGKNHGEAFATCTCAACLIDRTNADSLSERLGIKVRKRMLLNLSLPAAISLGI